MCPDINALFKISLISRNKATAVLLVKVIYNALKRT